MTDWQLIVMGAIGGGALTVFVGLVALAWRGSIQEDETDAPGD